MSEPKVKQVWKASGVIDIYIRMDQISENTIHYSILQRTGEWRSGGTTDLNEFKTMRFTGPVDQGDVDRVIADRSWWKNFFGREDDADDDPANHDIGCTCIFCIPGA